MKTASTILVVAGALFAAVGFFMSGAPGFSDTLNIGLLNDKSNLVMIGGFAFLGGIVLHAVVTLVAAIESATLPELLRAPASTAEVDSGAF